MCWHKARFDGCEQVQAWPKRVRPSAPSAVALQRVHGGSVGTRPGQGLGGGQLLARFTAAGVPGDAIVLQREYRSRGGMGPTVAPLTWREAARQPWVAAGTFPVPESGGAPSLDDATGRVRVCAFVDALGPDGRACSEPVYAR
jgi:hypothetical protein